MAPCYLYCSWSLGYMCEMSLYQGVWFKLTLVVFKSMFSWLNLICLWTIDRLIVLCLISLCIIMLLPEIAWIISAVLIRYLVKWINKIALFENWRCLFYWGLSMVRVRILVSNWLFIFPCLASCLDRFKMFDFLFLFLKLSHSSIKRLAHIGPISFTFLIVVSLRL